MSPLIASLRGLDADLRADAESRLEALAAAIRRWNESINLVSRKDITRLITYHFCDSASVLPLLDLRGTARVLDIGGSNGLPGLVLAALSPHVDVTICDARQKRRAFLEEVCAPRSGENAGYGCFEIDRVDGEAFRSRHAEGFDLILARAVTRLRLLVKWAMPLLRPGGKLIAFKGSRSIEEVAAAQSYFFAHGGGLLAVTESPLARQCNPLRLFVIAARSGCGTSTRESAVN